MAPVRKPKLRHYLQFRDLSRAEYEHLFARTRWIKDRSEERRVGKEC